MNSGTGAEEGVPLRWSQGDAFCVPPMPKEKERGMMLVKKRLMRLLTALLCLMLAVPSAMAANTTVLPEMEEYH